MENRETLINRKFEAKEFEWIETEKYFPEYIGRGSDQLVYKIPKHPDVVLKVSWKKMVESYEALLLISEDTQKPDSNELISKRLINEIAAKNLVIKKIQDCFGADHCLKERSFVLSVPITNKILSDMVHLHYLHEGSPPSVGINLDINRLTTIVSVQEKYKEVDHPSSIGFSYGKIQKQQPSEFFLNTMLLSLDSEKKQTTLLLDHFDNSWGKDMTRLFHKASTDTELNQLLIDFSKKAILFTQNHDRILDFVGHDNIIFSKLDGVWTYKLIDALPSNFDRTFTDVKNILQKEYDISMNVMDRKLCAQVIRYTAALNTIAKSGNSQNLLELPPLTKEQLNFIFSKD